MTTYQFKVSLLLIAATVSAIFATDMYTPSLPHMVAAFGTSISLVKLTMSSYLSGLCCSQLIYGPLSDRYGRRPVMIVGLIISVVGVFICAISTAIYPFIIGRILQGIGIGAALSLARAITTDIAKGDMLARMISMVSLVYSLAPALAPVIGGYLQEAFGWRSIFIVLSVYSLLSTWLVIRYLPETNAKLNPNALNFQFMLNSYFALLRDPVFMVHVIAAGISMSLGIVYYIYASFLIQDQLHYSAAQFGWISLFVTATIIGGRILNVALMRRYSPIQLVFLGSAMTMLSGIAMGVGVILGFFNLWVIIIPVMLFALAGGLIFANSVVEALHPFRHISGFAGALYGALQMGVVFVVSVLAAEIHSDNQTALAAFVVIGGAIIFFSYLIVMFKRITLHAAS